jgi:long-subunit acyl-CoA synthetase (AMP-forming)
VPLDTALHADQIKILLKDSGSSLLFCDVKHLATAQEAIGALPIKVALINPAEHKNHSPGPAELAPVADLESIFASGPGGFAPAAVEADVVASLLYTSGTTSNPKGVMLTHANLLGEERIQMGTRHRRMPSQPLFHVLSQMANLLAAGEGARVVYLETLDDGAAAGSQRAAITIFAVVPHSST